MANPLSPDGLARIQSITRQISIANDLDLEIQAELQSHLEEKVQGYLSGQEKLTEADAVMLAQSHFGNPAVIKNLFQQAHPHEYGVSLARRLAAAFVATTAAFAVLQILRQFVEMTYLQPALIDAVRSNTGQSPVPGLCISLTLSLISTGLLWAILARWRRQLDAGQAPWFQSLRPAKIAMISLAVICLGELLVMPLLLTDRTYQPRNVLGNYAAITAYYAAHPNPAWVPRVITALFSLTVAAQVFIWIWWCDRAPRTARTFLFATLGRIGTSFLVGPGVQWITLVPLILWNTLEEIVLTGRLSPHISNMFVIFANNAGHTLSGQGPAAIVALAAYLIWSRWNRGPAVIAE